MYWLVELHLYPLERSLEIPQNRFSIVPLIVVVTSK